jgi:hypothetical protein
MIRGGKPDVGEKEGSGGGTAKFFGPPRYQDFDAGSLWQDLGCHFENYLA